MFILENCVSDSHKHIGFNHVANITNNDHGPGDQTPNCHQSKINNWPVNKSSNGYRISCEPNYPTWRALNNFAVNTQGHSLAIDDD
jgi:hypothetical protein